MNAPIQPHRLSVANFDNGGESVNLEHEPRAMPVSFEGKKSVTVWWWAVPLGAGALTAIWVLFIRWMAS